MHVFICELIYWLTCELHNVFQQDMGPDTNSKYNTLFEMASSTSKDVSHIIKFYGTNFSSWKFGIWRFLEKFKLTSVVDGTESFPAQVTRILLTPA